MASEFVVENSRRKEFLVSKGLDVQDTAAWVQKWHTLQYHCKKNGNHSCYPFTNTLSLPWKLV